MARSTYVALYKAVMNINEDSRRPHGWHGLEGNRWIKRDTPTTTNACITYNITVQVRAHWHSPRNKKNRNYENV